MGLLVSDKREIREGIWFVRILSDRVEVQSMIGSVESSAVMGMSSEVVTISEGSYRWRSPADLEASGE